MKDLFDKIITNKGPLGKYADIVEGFEGYFAFPKLEGPIGNRMIFNGKKVITWSVNNYLGLANHPEIRETDLEAAKKRGIAVTNTPEVLSDATAEIGILLILGACRRVPEGIQAAKESNWKWSADYLIGKQLTGSRLGILGMGRIGQKIAKIAKSLGMIIHYHNRSKLTEEKEQGAIYHDSIKSLFGVSDVLSICCPATKETENLINKETLEYFPTGAVITNVARGDIVDDEALIDALNRRKIYAAGLDVYKGEPNLNPGYLKIKSAFILPHLGSSTKHTRTAMGNLAIDNIDEFFKTGNCTNKVN